MKTSVVVVTYRRLKNLGRILEAWLAETPDVWLCDCSEAGFETSLPVKILRTTPDPGNRIRHAVAALMTEGDLVIKADDDVLPRPGLAADFVAAACTCGPGIFGIHGRTFQGPHYYAQTTMVGAKQLQAPQPVDFVGVVTASPREFLPMDLRDCPSAVEDLYWQMACYPRAPKYVISSQAFMNLAESKDQGRLCGTPESRAVRVAYFRELYERNYR